ncbi:ABC transporter ATP-binding protein [uncultured Solobacterium sp.]|jgi:multidrug ABC transporter, permease/ATP-binding protein|uniref:ABC transporter ATP-binding protein n=1 Tax=uncultured Solobacterium sp. TaxID=747375 RepID=UPI0025CF262B|nr:ABC transporter ATP-binding protein [uncultured Solobacterium sp.]
MKKNSSFQTLGKVLKFIGKYKILLVFSVALSIVAAILQLYVPILFGAAIDTVIKQGEVHYSQLISTLIKIAICITVASISLWVMNLINNRLTYQTVKEIRAKAMRHMQHIPLSYLDVHSTGDIVQSVIADVDQLSDGLLLGFTQLFMGVVTIIATLVFMLSKNVLITCCVIVLTPVSFFVARFISTRSYRLFQKQTSTRGKQTALINEMIGSEKIVKAFGYERRASNRFKKLNVELQEYTQNALFISSLTNPSTRAVNNVIYAIVAVLGSYSIMKGNLTVGGLTVLLSYANQYMKPFNDISSVVTELQNAMACADRVFTLIEAPAESADPEQDLVEKNGAIDIQDVFFSYLPNQKLIENFNFSAKPGTTTAIVGPTGCGKTTFINLLMRFYDANQGTILIDGQNIYDVSRKSIRKNFGMVLQDTWLKNASIRDNIAFGVENASDEEIIEAAKEAHSWEFIRRMPHGLDTIVTDDSLSQGQKQLLCITRVLLSKPNMLILDEATSSIDTRTELEIQAAFNNLMRGRTSFVVAHRLSTIRNADQIIVMNAGKIIEQGNHDTLMAQNGFYSQLYNSQFVTTNE